MAPESFTLPGHKNVLKTLLILVGAIRFQPTAPSPPGLTGAPTPLPTSQAIRIKWARAGLRLFRMRAQVTVFWCRPSKRYKTDSGGN